MLSSAPITSKYVKRLQLETVTKLYGRTRPPHYGEAEALLQLNNLFAQCGWLIDR